MSCSRYITYSKEEEAVRCIQSVHGYILEGRPLRSECVTFIGSNISVLIELQLVTVSCCRACFGTTKYCHAWLRNMV